MRKVIVTWGKHSFGYVTLVQRVLDGEHEDALVEVERGEVSLRESELRQIVDALDAGTPDDGKFEFRMSPKSLGPVPAPESLD